MAGAAADVERSIHALFCWVVRKDVVIAILYFLAL